MVSNINCAIKSLSIAPIDFLLRQDLNISKTLMLIQLKHILPGPEGQSEVSLILDPEATSLIMAWSHTFVKFDHEILSTVILLHPLIQDGLCQLQSKVCA